MSGLVGFTRDTEMDFINKWLDSKPIMVTFVAAMMRNGALEAQYLKAMQGPTKDTLLRLGTRVFSDNCAKWRGLRLAACPGILASTLKRPEIEDWFKGEDKLQLHVAAKAVKFLFGVDDATSVPQGHQHAAFLGPLQWLFDQHIGTLGNKLEGTTKATLDNDSDWFVLDATGKKVMANTSPRVEVIFRGISTEGAADWVIVDGSSYPDASLVSVDADVDTKITRAFERQHAAPAFATPFHFPEDAEVPGFPNGGSSQGSSANQVGTPSSNAEKNTGVALTPLRTGIKPPLPSAS